METVVPNRGLDLVFGDILILFLPDLSWQISNSQHLSDSVMLFCPASSPGELRIPDAEKMLEEAGV